MCTTCSGLLRSCDGKVIYGISSSSSSVSCGGLYTYDITVAIAGTALGFTDPYCGTISFTDAKDWGSSSAYVYVGADCNSCSSEWKTLTISAVSCSSGCACAPGTYSPDGINS